MSHSSKLRTHSLVKTLIRCSSQFQQPVKLLWRKIIIEEINRIDLVPVLDHFIMAMRTGTFTGAAHPADHFTTIYSLTTSCLYLEHVAE